MCVMYAIELVIHYKAWASLYHPPYSLYTYHPSIVLIKTLHYHYFIKYHPISSYIILYYPISSYIILGKQGERIPLLLRNHHPTAQTLGILTHDFKSDQFSRGAGLAIRAGTTGLHAQATEMALQPWEYVNT